MLLAQNPGIIELPDVIGQNTAVRETERAAATLNPGQDLRDGAVCGKPRVEHRGIALMINPSPVRRM